MLGMLQEDRVSNFQDPIKRFKLKADTGHQGDKTVYKMMQEVAAATPLTKTLDRWLYRTPIDGSLPNDEGDNKVVERFVAKYLSLHEQLQQQTVERMAVAGMDPERIEKVKAMQQGNMKKCKDWLQPDGEPINRVRAALLFIESYRELPMLAWPRQLLDQVVELEESMLMFRFSHARMVERMIGRRVGTGGSSGVDYLDSTLQYRVFKDLWKVRTMLIKKDALFPLDTRAAKRFYEYQGYTGSAPGK
eukprot:TRINITY_DN12728_c0_g1_i3.p1 TRINITY_DN12728_c0_g1~~TRINITY_DN12728_c0_g1_i3.p1  ORF type:complete len:247 (+),score=73.40 TRINITY_DN12728_c0_g1_i3:452-1192(+)